MTDIKLSRRFESRRLRRIREKSSIPMLETILANVVIWINDLKEEKMRIEQQKTMRKQKRKTDAQKRVPQTRVTKTKYILLEEPKK